MSEENTNSLAELLQKRERELIEKQEELDSQRGMLSAAVHELVKNNEILKERNEELNRLLYQSSHSLKSPISSIQGIIQLCRYEPLTAALNEYLTLVEIKSIHMVDILNVLSSLSKVTTEDIHPQIIDINKTLNKCFVNHLPLAKKNQVTINYKPLVDSASIETDASLFSEILKQIINNGLVFRNVNKPGYLNISSSLTDKGLLIKIEDDGDGIDPLISDRIYEMFYRGSEKSSGSGLGLYISKKAVDLLHGTLHFTSTIKGTIFEIYLPNSLNASSTDNAY